MMDRTKHDGLRRLFLIASVALLCIVGAVGGVNHLLVRVADHALQEVRRIAEIQVHAQHSTLVGLIDVDAVREAFWLGDSHRIEQILTNILSNAIKFTEYGSVSITIAPGAGGGVELVVSDTGIGMTPAQVGVMFERFTQADNSTARWFSGTGLGMAIVARLVDAMGGTIDVQSEPGKGTRLAVALPLPQADPSQAEPESVPRGALPDGLQILVVDDSRTNLVVAQLMLKRMGSQAELVICGRAAVDLCARRRFDVVLMDISMPDIDGVAALKRIRAQEASAATPPAAILALTANVLPEQVASYLEAGFDGCIAKPLSQEALSTAIAQITSPADERGEAA